MAHNENLPCFVPADILLPDFGKVDGKKWAAIACDQFTSEPTYWEALDREVGDAPSALRLILPEVWLSDAANRIPAIHGAMDAYLKSVLVLHPDSLIYLEREQSDGKIRHGLVGAIDLEDYDYRPGATSLIRATEGTVLERIPPRVAVRRGAPLEAPHVMLLIDDAERTVIEPLTEMTDGFVKAYDFDLTEGSGHICGWFLDGGAKEKTLAALSALATPAHMKKTYGTDASPLLFAVGDGNHSLASAKAAYEEIKATLGEKALCHPARYALAEVVNLHDDALRFEPIYRVVTGVNPGSLLADLSAYTEGLAGNAEAQEMTWISGGQTGKIEVARPTQQLTVGTLQTFLDAYLKEHEGVKVDYIHDESSLISLASAPNSVGFLFRGMSKQELFPAVLFDGVLPRKTFSMGHARDKRFYIECRKIK